MKGASVLLLPTIALCLGFLAGWGLPQPSRLLILDVGQGDCAVYQNQGVTILIDDGPGGREGDGGYRTLRPALRRNGITDVDLVLLSHPDSDHVGGTPELLREFPHARIAMSQFFESQSKMDKDLALWGVPLKSVMWLPNESQISWGTTKLRVLCPPVTERDNDNWGSMFVQISDSGATADFSGDAPSEVEKAVAQRGGWSADILHVGHHGSKSSSGADWLDSVRPSIAAISCGRDNAYGHPHHAVLQRLEDRHIAIARTDLEGDLKFEPQGGHFSRVP